MRRLPLIALLAAAVSVPAVTAGEPAPGAPSAAPVSCRLGLLPDPDHPENPRIALFRVGDGSAGDDLVLDTGYPLSAVERTADREALDRKAGPFSCRITRDPKAPRDWETALTGMLGPGFRGEALLHQGEVQKAVETFFRGLPDPRSAAWLGQAARNIPQPVASLLPGALRSRDLRRVESALEILGALVSIHPAAAEDSVREALGIRRRALRPRAIFLAGEEAAGLRSVRPATPGGDFLSGRIREALEKGNAAERSAAADALLLSEPEEGRRIELLAAAARKERDPRARAAIVSALRQTGGIEEIFRLTRSGSPGLRREALRAVAGLPEWPPEETDPLERLHREGLSDPGEVPRTLGARRGELAGRWAAILEEILPGLRGEERRAIPGLICRLDDSGPPDRGLSLLLGMARAEKEPGIASAAMAALGTCGAARRDESLEVLLEAVRDLSRGEEVLTAAAEAAADLAVAPEDRARVLGALRSSLESGGEALRRASIAGLARLGRRDASPPTEILAAAALRIPPDATAGAAEEGLRRLFGINPGPVTSALREWGRTLPEDGQARIFDLFRRLQAEDRARILDRWRAALSTTDPRVGPALESEMISLADYWPGEILDLIQPAFEASRDEERIRLLDLMVALGRHFPDRILELLALPENPSPRLREATREAVAATLALKVLAEKSKGPGDLFVMALDPADSGRRLTGRRALWLLCWEYPPFRGPLSQWARTERGRASLPLRVELGRWLGQVSELGPTRSPATAVERWEPRKARFPRGTSGGSDPAPSGPPAKDAGTGSRLPGAGG